MKLEGKKINFLGDSITEGVGVTDCANCRYDNVLRKKYGLTTNNYGISGTRLAHQEKPSGNPRMDLCFCGRAYDIDPTADITVVYGGVNDYIHGDAPIGTASDSTPATFWGGVNFLMNLFKTKFPDMTVVFMTPARCYFADTSDEEVSKNPMKGAGGMPLLEYVEIIKAAGEAHGIHVLDLYHSLPINPNLPEDCGKYTIDGLHFNDAGQAVLAGVLEEFLLKI